MDESLIYNVSKMSKSFLHSKIATADKRNK